MILTHVYELLLAHPGVARIDIGPKLYPIINIINLKRSWQTFQT